jgi:O-antigen ligase
MKDLDRIARFLWGAALLALPVTSFRYFPFMGAGTFVRPLAFYPIALLLVLLLVQWMRGKTSFPRAGALTPLAGFVLVALAASSLGALYDPLPLRGQEYLGRVVRAWATVVIGASFFISAIWMNRDEADVRFTVRWLLAGFVMTALWSGVQLITFYTPLLERETVAHWQLAFSMRELEANNRVSGMAFEPSWLAGQIANLYLPWIFAALLTRVRATRFRFFEILLLVVAIGVLLTTYSRGGLLSVILATVLTAAFAGREELRAAWTWFVSGFRRGKDRLLRFGILLVIGSALTGAGYFLSQREYIRLLFTAQADSIEEYFIKNSAGPRAAYFFGALGAYAEHPLTGVGLGASGFYIYDKMPDWAMTFEPEIARQFSPEDSSYPNPKNMYGRLLAETGLVGFFMFIAFQFFLLGEVLSAFRNGSSFMRYLGIAGLFSWVAVAMFNTTQDSFAMPDLWLVPGIVIGVMLHASGSTEKEADFTSVFPS